MSINGVSEVSRVWFGLHRGLTRLDYTQNVCAGSIEAVGGNDVVVGLDWQPDEPCVKLEDSYLRMANIRTSSMWPTELTLVDHPVWGPPTVVDCEGNEMIVPVEQRGIAGVGRAGYVPCTDTLPLDAATWTDVKARFRRGE